MNQVSLPHSTLDFEAFKNNEEEKEPFEEEKKEFSSQKTIKQLILNIAEKRSDEIHYKEPSERILHKMVSNTLGYYQLNDYFNTDQIMKLFSDHDLMKYWDAATNNSDVNELNSRIDLGEYPIARCVKKKKEQFSDIESQISSSQSQKKESKPKELIFIPPTPNKFLDVITYSECSPILKVREDQLNEETLKLTDADRQEFVDTISTVNKILKPLRGKVASLDRLILLFLLFGFLIFGGIASVCGVFVHFTISIAWAVIYFVILGVLVYLSKKRSSTLIENAHMCLSLFLHVENNRYYKSK